MKTYVALLRGINVGGHNRVSMPELREVFAALGAGDVATYVQSGNVVFASDGTPSGLVDAIETSIRRDLGLDVTVLLRTHAQLAKIIAGNPFAAADPAKLLVTFLAGKPDGARVRKLDPDTGRPDRFRLVGQELYVHCPNGYGRTKLTNAFFERQLGVAATTRNWKSVTKLSGLAGVAGPRLSPQRNHFSTH